MGTVVRYTTPGGQRGYEARDSWLDPATGQRMWRRKRFQARPGLKLTEARDEAEAWLAKRMTARARSEFWEPSREPLGSLIDRWADNLGPPLSGNTIVAYRSQARSRFDAAVRARPVGEITNADVRNLLSAWADQDLAPETIAVARHVLRSVIGLAIAERGIVDDPTAGIRIERKKGRTTETWSPAQVAVFLDKTRAHEFGYAWELLFATLARIGELAALRWDDLVDGRLIIRRTWGKSPDGRMQIADQTKTHLQRAVPLPASTLAMLERVRNGRAADSEWIIEIKGAPVSPHKLRHAWSQAIAGMKLPELSPHGARHSGATNMIAAGVPVRSVQRILGHTSVHMTLERYVHPTDSDTAAAVEALDTLYRGAKAKNIVKNVSDENPPHENSREDAGI